MSRTHYQSFISPYSLPPRTAKSATERETERLSRKLSRTETDKWCDEYIARLYGAKLVVHDDEGKEKVAGGTSQRVLAAMCSLMRDAECGCFTAQVRAVAARATVDIKTAHRVLRRMENEAYILRHPACDADDPTAQDRYSLVIERLPKAQTPVKDMHNVTDLESLASGNLFLLTTERQRVPSEETNDERDAREALDRRQNPFHSRNVGPNATAIYNYLCLHEGLIKAEIAREVGLTATTITNNLKKLESQGMVVEGDKNRWYTCTARIRDDTDTEMITRQCARERSERKAAREIEKANHIADLKASNPDDWQMILEGEEDAAKEERRFKSERVRQRKEDKIKSRQLADYRKRQEEAEREAAAHERIEMAPAGSTVRSRIATAKTALITGDAAGGYALNYVPVCT